MQMRLFGGKFKCRPCKWRLDWWVGAEQEGQGVRVPRSSETREQQNSRTRGLRCQDPQEYSCVSLSSLRLAPASLVFLKCRLFMVIKQQTKLHASGVARAWFVPIPGILFHSSTHIWLRAAHTESSLSPLVQKRSALIGLRRCLPHCWGVYRSLWNVFNLQDHQNDWDLNAGLPLMHHSRSSQEGILEQPCPLPIRHSCFPAHHMEFTQAIW